MIEYSVFDSILDATFVVSENGKIAYCNDAAATFCQTSVRRVVGKAVLSDLLSVVEPNILPFGPTSQGFNSPTSIIETTYILPKAGKTGKIQLSIRPVDSGHWVIFIRDVSLEEALHSKYRSELSQKEEYAKNLEKLVEARTAELRHVNLTLNAILDSLGQGFFTFDSTGKCGSVFTKACAEILEGIPNQRKAWEVLAIPDQEQNQFKQWMESTFSELLPFEDLKTLGPNLFPHSQQRRVSLDYYPIRRDQKSITDIVVVATDKTAEHQAQVALELERQYATMVVKYLKNKDQFLEFLVSARSAIQKVQNIASEPLEGERLNETLRILHTIEGEAGIFSIQDLRRKSRESQHILEAFKSSAGVPVETQALFIASMHKMSENFEKFLVDNQNIFKIPDGEVKRSVDLQVTDVQAFLTLLRRRSELEDLQRTYCDLFLKVPIESRLKYFDGLIQTVGERLGKMVKPLKIVGGELRIFPEPYSGLFSNLVHAFRNAVDHGLEEPTEREWGGKDPAGQIVIEIKDTTMGFHLNIRDDGKGIDPKIIREKLKTKFPDRDTIALSDQEIIQAVTWPGFSSRDSVGEFSGRGVGLDALSEEVLSIGGQLHLISEVGQGTTIEIFVPHLGIDLELLRSA